MRKASASHMQIQEGNFPSPQNSHNIPYDCIIQWWQSHLICVSTHCDVLVTVNLPDYALPKDMSVPLNNKSESFV